MQQFALASIRPRSIAWLIRLDEWERLETIIKYNCAMLGGYYNVMIPLTDQDTLAEKYQHFLWDYDPDLVVLAPDMPPQQVDLLAQQSHAFCLINWNEVERIASIDPLSSTQNMNLTMAGPIWHEILSENVRFPGALIATSDDDRPDASKLALVACGDVQPCKPLLNVFNGEVDLDADGYREGFLRKFVRPEYGQRDVMAAWNDGSSTPAPNRYKLKDIIMSHHRFPLSGIYETLNACYRLQRHVTINESFIGLTAHYKGGVGAPQRLEPGSCPTIVILISQSFGMEEAILFWNLRAMEVLVSWLSFSDIENNSDELNSWLEADGGGGFYTMMNKFQLTFSSNRKDIKRLQEFLADFKHRREQKVPGDMLFINVMAHEELVFYDYVRPCVKQEHISLANDGNKIVFLPKSPFGDGLGSYSVELEYSALMLPRGINFTGKWETLYGKEYFYIALYSANRSNAISSWRMPYCRVDRNHYLLFQVHTEKPIETNLLSIQSIVASIFQKANFPRIELSSTARYHTIFIDKAGSLDQAAHYLADAPYRLLLEVLADNEHKNKPGWLLEHPSKRRVFNHFDLWRMVGESIPSETDEYYRKLSDKLPQEIIALLEKRILERGFLITCTSCSFKSWYPAEHIGQDFTCTRCFQQQVYQSNPLWLYKLPEIVFQGFNNDMQVPLLALDYMRRKSKHCFEWMPDSNVFWMEGKKEISRNIDIICICDGELYVGEAKSAGSIEKDQFLFYQQVCQKVAVDGIIFATSQKRWDKKTLGYIDTLKQGFSGQVLVLTEDNLYPEKQ